MGSFDSRFRRGDSIRYPVGAASLGGSFKEWHHFCVLADGYQVILNLSLSADTRPAGRGGGVLGRTVLLVHAGSWEGGADTPEPARIQFTPGLVDLVLGSCEVRYGRGWFQLAAEVAEVPLALFASLSATDQPLLLTPGVEVGGGEIGWFAAPRLEARGRVIGRHGELRFEGASAYHDHNWGRWRWGEDFTWQWGFAHLQAAGTNWSMVFDHTTNRSRTVGRELTLALWRDGRLCRLFTREDVEVERHGFLPACPLLKIPRALALTVPEITTDVPSLLCVRATLGNDSVLLQFRPESVAQVLLPNETDLGTTVINETVGDVTLEGVVLGERLTLAGRGIFEFLC